MNIIPCIPIEYIKSTKNPKPRPKTFESYEPKIFFLDLQNPSTLYTSEATDIFSFKIDKHKKHSSFYFGFLPLNELYHVDDSGCYAKAYTVDMSGNCFYDYEIIMDLQHVFDQYDRITLYYEREKN